GRPRGSRQRLPRRPFRWSAAASGDRTGHHRRAPADPGRRTHRRAGLRHRRAGHEDDPGPGGCRSCRHPGHARPAPRRLGGPDRVPARRAHRRPVAARFRGDDPGGTSMSARARPGVILKLAWRQLLRTAGSSVLIMALIAVPVAGAVGVLTFVESRTPTPEQAVTLELGQTQSWIRIDGGPDPSRVQAVDFPWMTSMDRADDGSPAHPELPAPTDLGEAELPGGTASIPIAEGYERMTTRDGVAGFTVLYGDSWDDRLEGRYERV